MNNILTFEDYRMMNIRQVESVIYRQFIENDIKDEISEGFIRNAINKAAGNFIQNALAEEIEKGKELEKSIHEALDGLNKGFEEIKTKINGDKASSAESKTKLNAIEKVKEAIKAVQSQAFDTLTMIGSEGEIDFAGFMGSASVVAATRFGIILTPISSLFITRKAYKYFLGIIKQTIRRNLLVIQLNFDQFENLILQKSFEAEGESEANIKREALSEIIGAMTQDLCKSNTLGIVKGEKNIRKMKTYLQTFKDAQKVESDLSRNNPLTSLWQDQHNNTYTRTLEQIKQYINDDSQKELDALKNSITKMAGNDVDLTSFGELMISAAEEYAIKTNHGINNNFIKMSSVFNLDNQKKLIELIVETQKENEEELKKRKDLKEDLYDKTEELEKDIETGKELYEEKLSKTTYTFDDFEKEFSDDDIKCIKKFFQTDEGQEAYKSLCDKYPLYKYLFMDVVTLNNLLNAMVDLNIFEISNKDDMDYFYSNYVDKDQIAYYAMAEQSIKDAVESKESEEYFGYVDNIKESKSTDDLKEINTEDILLDDDKEYLLTFDKPGNNLFNILHKDFKTEIFNNEKEYVDNISLENKETLIKLIHKYLNIGNDIITSFAKYLVILEAHMLLKKQKSWFVVKNNKELKDCFEPNSEKIINENAFVKINNDYVNINKFLKELHNLSDNDYIEID